jgi:membrane-associated phospholipid phosphatase
MLTGGVGRMTSGSKRSIAACRLRVMLLAATLSATIFVAFALVAAQQEFIGLDPWARDIVEVARDPLFNRPMKEVSRLGAGEGLIPLIAISSLVLWRRSRRWAVWLPVIMAGSGLLQLLTKWAIDRPRPNLAAWGFPSGHALSVVVFFGLMVYIVCSFTPRSRWRCLVTAACLPPVLVVGYSRLYLEMHWLSDVLGGFAAGLAYLLVSILVVELLGDRSARRAAPVVTESGASDPPLVSAHGGSVMAPVWVAGRSPSD